MDADVTEAAIDMLGAYRRYCAAGSSPGQLILPESLKLLPLYATALGKSDAFMINLPQLSTGGTAAAAGGRAGAGRGLADISVRTDLRVVALHAMNSMPPSRIVPAIYGRLFPLHNLGGAQGVALDSDDDGDGSSAQPPTHPANLSFDALSRVVLPPSTYPSAEQLTPHGVYLLEAPAGLFLYVGLEADVDVVRGLFGPTVPGAGALPRGASLPQPPEDVASALGTPSELSLRVWTIIAALRARRPPYQRLTVVVPADIEARDLMGAQLVEDRLGSARSYVDLLCYVHTTIQARTVGRPA